MSIAAVAQYAPTFGSTTSPLTVSVTVAANDWLAVVGFGSTDGFGDSQTLSTPTGGGLTYTLGPSQVGVNPGTLANIYCWTAPCSSGQTFTMSISTSGLTAKWGYFVLRFSGVASIGSHNQNSNTTGLPSLALTTTVAHSAIVFADVDFSNTISDATYNTSTAGTFTETIFNDSNSSPGSVWGGYYLDSGTAGSKTAAQLTPNFQEWACVATILVPSVVAPSIPGKIIQSRTALVRAASY